jgi:hypothetical protein
VNEIKQQQQRQQQQQQQHVSAAVVAATDDVQLVLIKSLRSTVHVEGPKEVFSDTGNRSCCKALLPARFEPYSGDGNSEGTSSYKTPSENAAAVIVPTIKDWLLTAPC